MLLLHPKVHDFQAIHNLIAAGQAEKALLLHPKVHDFQAIHNRREVGHEISKLLLHPKVHDFQAIHNKRTRANQRGEVVTTSKGTWFSSNSQHKMSSNQSVNCCYYIQRYMIFKQFTTFHCHSLFFALLLLHPKVHDFQAIHNKP